MPYLGKSLAGSSSIRRFNVTSSTSATHTLTWAPPTEQSIIVSINGVKQHEDAYSISGTTLTLTNALVATDKMEVIGINDVGTTVTAAQGSVNTDKLADDAVTTAKIADDQVTTAKIANDQVTTAKIADDQITTAKIADDQITSAKLANTLNITSGNSLTIDSGATVTNNGTASGFGKVLQVVSANHSTQASTTSTSFVATGLSASITPSSSSNNILVMFEMPLRANKDGYANATIYRGATNLSNATSGFGIVGFGANFAELSLANVGAVYLDSPATTSATTYYIYFKSNGITAYSCISSATATLTLMEIAA